MFPYRDFSFLTSLPIFQNFLNTMAVIVYDNPIYVKAFLKSDDVSFLTSYDVMLTSLPIFWIFFNFYGRPCATMGFQFV